MGMIEIVLYQRVQQRDVLGPDMRQDKSKIGEWTAAKFNDAVESASGDCLIATEVGFMVVITVIVRMDLVGHPSLAFVPLGFLPSGLVYFHNALLSQVLEIVAIAQAFNRG